MDFICKQERTFLIVFFNKRFYVHRCITISFTYWALRHSFHHNLFFYTIFFASMLLYISFALTFLANDSFLLLLAQNVHYEKLTLMTPYRTDKNLQLKIRIARSPSMLMAYPRLSIEIAPAKTRTTLPPNFLFPYTPFPPLHHSHGSLCYINDIDGPPDIAVLKLTARHGFDHGSSPHVTQNHHGSDSVPYLLLRRVVNHLFRRGHRASCPIRLGLSVKHENDWKSVKCL